MRTSQIQQLSATGDVTTRDTFLRAVVLAAGSDAATATVREGGSGGTVRLTVKAAANTTEIVPLPDVQFSEGVHVTLAGTGPVVSFCYA